MQAKALGLKQHSSLLKQTEIYRKLLGGSQNLGRAIEPDQFGCYSFNRERERERLVCCAGQVGHCVPESAFAGSEHRPPAPCSQQTQSPSTGARLSLLISHPSPGSLPTLPWNLGRMPAAWLQEAGEMLEFQ